MSIRRMERKHERKVVNLTQPKLTCDQCGKEEFHIDEMTGEIVCILCGMVHTERGVSLGPESLAHTPEQYESRLRTKPLDPMHHDFGMTTVIPWEGRDHAGRSLSYEAKSQVHRMRKHQNRASLAKSQSRNFTVASSYIQRLGTKLSLPKAVKQQAATLYRRCLAKDLIRGREIQTVAGACTYMACRLSQTPRSLKDIATMLGCEKKTLARVYRMILRRLDYKMPVQHMKPYIGKIVAALNLSGEVEIRAIALAELCITSKISAGKDPAGLAAAIVYIVSREMDLRVTQRELSKLSDTTEVTIRNRYKDIVTTLELDIDLPTYTKSSTTKTAVPKTPEPKKPIVTWEDYVKRKRASNADLLDESPIEY